MRAAATTIPPPMEIELSSELSAYRQSIVSALESLLPQSQEPILEAMRYALLGGGKRIRPLLVCCTATGLGSTLDQALPAACAVECIHAYSLIHDDLPIMDDDDLRHGKPSCHKVFGEAQAVLAGDALQALAFQTLADARTLSAEKRLRMVAVLASASGWSGMAGGQWLDISQTGNSMTKTRLEDMHRRKTAALIAAATQMGALTSDCATSTTTALKQFGEELGLVFQMVDDLLDVTGSTAELGKPAGSDVALGKNTYPALWGEQNTRDQIEQRLQQCFDALRRLKLDQGGLGELTRLVAKRVS